MRRWRETFVPSQWAGSPWLSRGNCDSPARRFPSAVVRSLSVAHQAGTFIYPIPCKVYHPWANLKFRQQAGPVYIAKNNRGVSVVRGVNLTAFVLLIWVTSSLTRERAKTKGAGKNAPT